MDAKVPNRRTSPIARALWLALACVTLAGCVVVPGRPYYYRPAPAYYYGR